MAGEEEQLIKDVSTMRMLPDFQESSVLEGMQEHQWNPTCMGCMGIQPCTCSNTSLSHLQRQASSLIHTLWNCNWLHGSPCNASLEEVVQLQMPRHVWPLGGPRINNIMSYVPHLMLLSTGILPMPAHSADARPGSPCMTAVCAPSDARQLSIAIFQH